LNNSNGPGRGERDATCAQRFAAHLAPNAYLLRSAMLGFLLDAPVSGVKGYNHSFFGIPEDFGQDKVSPHNSALAATKPQ